VEVVFSKIAEEGLTKEFGETEKRDNWRLSITLHLKNSEILDKSIRLPRPFDQQVYAFFLSDVRITFQWSPDKITVWSVGRKRQSQTT
jgi:hypothetical protein